MAHGIPVQGVFPHKGTCKSEWHEGRELHTASQPCKASSEGGTASLPSCLPEVRLASSESFSVTRDAGEFATSSTPLEEQQNCVRPRDRKEGDSGPAHL